MNNSIDQLVAMGILDKDFLELDDASIKTGAMAELPSPVHEPGTLIVEYMDRPEGPEGPEGPGRPRRPRSRSPASIPDDIDYYSNVNYHWLYSSPSYGWWHFTKQDNEVLERLYLDYKLDSDNNHPTLDIGKHNYIIDFNKMTQKGMSGVRQILRVTSIVDISLKGVAKSRISKRDITTKTLDVSNFTDLLTVTELPLASDCQS